MENTIDGCKAKRQRFEVLDFFPDRRSDDGRDRLCFDLLCQIAPPVVAWHSISLPVLFRIAILQVCVPALLSAWQSQPLGRSLTLASTGCIARQQSGKPEGV